MSDLVQADLGLWVKPGRSSVVALPAPTGPHSGASPLRLSWKLSANGLRDRSGELLLEPQASP